MTRSQISKTSSLTNRKSARGPTLKLSVLLTLAAIVGAIGSTPAQAQTDAPVGHITWQPSATSANTRSSSNATVQTTTGDNYLTSIITIRNARAPSSYSFTLTVPAGQRLVPTADGGMDAVLDLANGQKIVVGRIDVPWARDAKGKSVPTSLTVTANTLTQWVDTKGAVFPVTADPHYTWGIVTGTVYLSRHETNLLIGGTTIFAIVAGAAFGGWGAVPPGGMAAYATYVYNEGHCIKIKLVPIGAYFLYYPGEYWGSDGDGYCR
jgi:hypothetical protein